MALNTLRAAALAICGFACTLVANAQTPSPAPAMPATGVATSRPDTATPAPRATNAGGGSIVPGSLSGTGGGSPSTGAPAGGPATAPSIVPAMPSASPQPSSTAPGRFRLERPGTNVEGDLLTGNAASDAYVFHGNVIMHSDPRIDPTFRATGSEEPITLTADELDIDRAGLTYVAKGHVRFVQGARTARADLGLLNEQTHDLDLLGNADVVEGERRVRAQKMHYNLSDGRFHGLGDVRIYQPAPTPNPSTSSTPAPKRRRRLPL